MTAPIDLEELKRLLEKAWRGTTSTAEDIELAASFRNALPMLIEELEAAREDAARLHKRLEVENMERLHNRAMFDAAVQRLVKISSFVQGPEIVLPDGRRFKFSPPDSLVREAWEGLSAAILGIDAAIDAARKDSA